MASRIAPFQSSELNIYYTKTSGELKTDCARAEKLYKIAYKVLSIALVAISLAVFIVSLTAAPTATYVPLLLIGFILLSPIVHFTSEHLYEKGENYERQKATHEKVDLLIQRQNLLSWTNEEISSFLQREQIHIPQEIQQKLPFLNNRSPLHTLLPVIARYRHFMEVAKQEAREAHRLLEAKIDDPLLQAILVRNGYSSQEKAIQHLLNAALMRVLLCEPTRKEHSYTDLGSLFSVHKEPQQEERDPVVSYRFQPHKKGIRATEFDLNVDLRFLQKRLSIQQEESAV